MQLIAVFFTAALLASAADRGLPPRAQVSDYPAHQTTATAILAAAIVPSRQIQGMFTADIARHYVVLEVAIYPQQAQLVKVDLLKFVLKVGDTAVYVGKPADVANPWTESNKIPGPPKPVSVTTTTGVVFEKGTDPDGQRRGRVGTYEDVAVTTGPQAAPPLSPAPPPPSQDPYIVEQRIAQVLLPEGDATTAIAGYLFFPLHKMKLHKGTIVELQWSPPQEAAATVRLEQK
jgi:hypothetical protein